MVGGTRIGPKRSWPKEELAKTGIGQKRALPHVRVSQGVQCAARPMSHLSALESLWSRQRFPKFWRTQLDVPSSVSLPASARCCCKFSVVRGGPNQANDWMSKMQIGSWELIRLFAACVETMRGNTWTCSQVCINLKTLCWLPRPTCFPQCDLHGSLVRSCEKPWD